MNWVYLSVLSAAKGKSKFEILLVKIFSLKQKIKSNTSSYYNKIKFLLFKKIFDGSFR